MLEDEKYRIDFEKMTVWGKQDFIAGMSCPIQVLNDLAYIGQPNFWSGMMPSTSWYYLGDSKDESRRYFELYVSYQLDKALGLESA